MYPPLFYAKMSTLLYHCVEVQNFNGRTRPNDSTHLTCVGVWMGPRWCKDKPGRDGNSGLTCFPILECRPLLSVTCQEGLGLTACNRKPKIAETYRGLLLCTREKSRGKQSGAGTVAPQSLYSSVLSVLSPSSRLPLDLKWLLMLPPSHLGPRKEKQVSPPKGPSSLVILLWKHPGSLSQQLLLVSHWPASSHIVAREVGENSLRAGHTSPQGSQCPGRGTQGQWVWAR